MNNTIEKQSVEDVTQSQKRFLIAATKQELWCWREDLKTHWKTWESVWANGWVEQINTLHDGCDREYWRLTDAGREAINSHGGCDGK